MPTSKYATTAEITQAIDDIYAIADMIDARLLAAQRVAMRARAKADIEYARSCVTRLVGIVIPHFEELVTRIPEGGSDGR